MWRWNGGGVTGAYVLTAALLLFIDGVRPEVEAQVTTLLTWLETHEKLAGWFQGIVAVFAVVGVFIAVKVQIGGDDKRDYAKNMALAELAAVDVFCSLNAWKGTAEAGMDGMINPNIAVEEFALRMNDFDRLELPPLEGISKLYLLENDVAFNLTAAITNFRLARILCERGNRFPDHTLADRRQRALAVYLQLQYVKEHLELVRGGIINFLRSRGHVLLEMGEPIH